MEKGLVLLLNKLKERKRSDIGSLNVDSTNPVLRVNDLIDMLREVDNEMCAGDEEQEVMAMNYSDKIDVKDTLRNMTENQHQFYLEDNGD